MSQTLTDKRIKFSQYLARLIMYSASRGMSVQIREVTRKPVQSHVQSIVSSARVNLVDVLRKTGYHDLSETIKACTETGIRYSAHSHGLAADLEITIQGQQAKKADYEMLAQIWKQFNDLNRWGGDTSNEFQHYSMEHEGIK